MGRTPFGLVTAPYSMLHILLHVSGPAFKLAKAALYMDDLVNVGSSWADNLQNVRTILQMFRAIVSRLIPENRNCNGLPRISGI